MNINDFEPGQYREQYQYKSFSLTTINHAWSHADSQVQRLLSDADRALGKLDVLR